MRILFRTVSVSVCCLLMIGSSVQAQTYKRSPFEEDAFEPVKRKRKTSPPPPLRLVLRHERPIPGPVSDATPMVDDESLVIPLSAGALRVVLESDGLSLETVPGGRLPDAREDPWRSGDDARLRFRTFPDGVVLAQKRTKGHRKTWRKKWKLRTPGSTAAPPLVSGNTVFFGSSDNRIYAVKARNGHRLWTSDLDDRISLPLAIWAGDIGLQRPVELVLAVPDGGGKVVALDAWNGDEVATYQIAGSGDRLASPAMVLPGGLIAVAKQRYKETEASLLIIELEIAADDSVERKVEEDEGDS